MVNKLIDDIKKALDNDLYYVALASALTLPDICGKAEYPQERSTKKRYVAWYNERIGKYEKNHHVNFDMPYLSGEVVYCLRCSFLHEGNPNVDNEKLVKWNTIAINRFVLIVERKNEFDIYCDISEKSTVSGQHSGAYFMNIRRICWIICEVAKEYYESNRSNFSFNFEIKDMDRISQHRPKIDVDDLLERLADPDLGKHIV